MTDENVSFGNINKDIAKLQTVKKSATTSKKWIPKAEYVAKLKAEGKYNPQGYATKVAPKVQQTAVQIVEEGVDVSKHIPICQNIVNQEKLLKALMIAWKENFPVLLIGETGTGKTVMVKELYHRLGLPLLRLNLNGNTTTDEFTGKMILTAEGTKYINGLLTRAMIYGYGLLLDEVNVGRPEVLFILQAVAERTDSGTLTELTLAENHGEVITPHPSFRIFATMNPTDGYVGTNDLNEAFKDRFPLKIKVPYPDKATEVKIIKSKLPKMPKVSDAEIEDAVLLAQDIRNGAKQGEYEKGISTRNLIQWFLVNEHYNNLIESAQYTILGGCNTEDALAIESILKVYFTANMTVSDTDGETGQKYRKGQVIQACDDMLEVHHVSKYIHLGNAKKSSIFEITQVKGGKLMARLLRGDVIIPEKTEHRNDFQGGVGDTVSVSSSTIIRLDNVEVCRTRRVDTTSKR